MSSKIVWTTPGGDDLIAYMARVSNPNNQNNTETSDSLIQYLIHHKHWSPFEMVYACVEIETTRDMSRELLRHKSFAFQEFSQRYANPLDHMEMVHREARLAHKSNRQSSIDCEDTELSSWWEDTQSAIEYYTSSAYVEAIKKGLAKEVARTVLPEGMTPTRLYMCGNIRSWIHFWDARTDSSAQKEVRNLAKETKILILEKYPKLASALDCEALKDIYA